MNSTAKFRAGVLISLQAAVLVLILLFCDVKYEVSDDFVMELIASGAFQGTPDGHLMFCSVLWGKLLNLLYEVSSGISWYFWAQIGVSFLALCGFSCYLAETMSLPEGVLISGLMGAFFARDLYLLPQFTKTAAAAIASGGCLFVWGLFRKKGKGYVLLGGALVVLGCLIRHNGIYIAGVYLLLYVLLETGSLVRKKPADLRKRMRKIYLRGALLLVLVYGLRWCNNMAYECREDYRYYMDYSYARAYLVDYPLPEYETCEEELSEIGISRTDYELIVSWCFADREVFSLEKMKEVLSVVEKYRPVVCETFWEVVLRFLGRGILWYPGTCCCVLLGILSLGVFRKRFWAAVAAGAVTVGMMLYFIQAGHAVYRVEFGCLFSAAVMMVFALPGETDKERKTEGKGAAAAGQEGRWGRTPVTGQAAGCGFMTGEKKAGRWWLYLLAVGIIASQVGGYLPDRSYESLSDEEYRDYVDSTFYFSWDYDKEKYTKSVNKREIRPHFLQEVREHPENLYLLDFNTTIQTLYYDFSPFESLEKGALGNMVYLGGVTVNHPVIRETLAKWKIEDALPGLLKENVYFVSNTTSEQVLAYLREYYDKGASMKLWKTVDGYEIWKYEASGKGEVTGNAGALSADGQVVRK